ncbi:hypothetical protein GWP85_16885 [Acinetobacter beijerinckii]|uniref:hypothetical protein n=1 Tax=Acinetobacter beijerinckii TaxID=262668 RepID=UPI0023DD9282|nr:hypothetical protein [Acinetobacter beijerinckii]MDF2419168.1 hypothetical protein [Acinetobacter beijerinckii]
MNIAVTKSFTFGHQVHVLTTNGYWWQSEMNVLESMLQERKAFAEIAEVLNCPIDRVRKRVALLQSKGGRPKQKFRRTRGAWWDCEVTVLKAMLQENFKVSYIAEVLDRDTNCVHTKIKYLQTKGEL